MAAEIKTAATAVKATAATSLIVNRNIPQLYPPSKSPRQANPIHRHLRPRPAACGGGDALRVQIDLSTLAKAVSQVRETLILPRVRANFAAPLPEDIRFRDCYFAGSVTAQLNLRIIEILTDGEIQRLQNLLSAAFDGDAVTGVERLAPLPEGIGGLHARLK